MAREESGGWFNWGDSGQLDIPTQYTPPLMQIAKTGWCKQLDKVSNKQHSIPNTTCTCVQHPTGTPTITQPTPHHVQPGHETRLFTWLASSINLCRLLDVVSRTRDPSKSNLWPDCRQWRAIADWVTFPSLNARPFSCPRITKTTSTHTHLLTHTQVTHTTPYHVLSKNKIERSGPSLMWFNVYFAWSFQNKF